MEVTIRDLNTKGKEAVKDSFSSLKDELKSKTNLKFKDIQHSVVNFEQFLGTATDQKILKDLMVAEVRFPAKPRRHSVTKLSFDEASITSPKEVAETLNNRFQKVFTTPDREIQFQINLGIELIKPMSPITVSKDNIEARLKNVNQNKSEGPDRIHPWTSKEVHAELALTLPALFKKSMDKKTVPWDWQNATIEC
ncbi:hypothetical protein QYM36_015539 [Artemia franciscana]|uniref:Uncharacterized protein n=1 Tax=Artemia franciscana TaxID=6661 RepID=A0AA88H9F4_ARTSF|nr:hypothetical protein QYM36_015539 [Artemia franciscana]